MNIPDPRQWFALDRRAIARAFDRASGSYDAAAALQERVRNELLSRLDELKVKPSTVLDLGAGTGHGTRALKQRFPKSLVVAADIAPGMLERAKTQSRWLRRFERVGAKPSLIMGPRPAAQVVGLEISQAGVIWALTVGTRDRRDVWTLSRNGAEVPFGERSTRALGHDASLGIVGVLSDGTAWRTP